MFVETKFLLHKPQMRLSLQQMFQKWHQIKNELNIDQYWENVMKYL